MWACLNGQRPSGKHRPEWPFGRWLFRYSRRFHCLLRGKNKPNIHADTNFTLREPGYRLMNPQQIQGDSPSNFSRLDREETKLWRLAFLFITLLSVGLAAAA